MLALGSSGALVQVALVLLGLLGGLTLLNRRLNGGPRAGGAGDVVQLTPHDAVHVVQIDGRRLLIGTGSNGAPRLLCELGTTDAPVEAATGGP